MGSRPFVAETRLLHYEDDCFAPPWTSPETVVLIHGSAESAAVWYGWMPTLTAHFRVMRPDLRGFGRSAARPDAPDDSLAAHAADVMAVLDALAVQRAHVVGAKFGGAVAIEMATTWPERVMTLTLAGTLVTGSAAATNAGTTRIASQLSRGHAMVIAGSQRSRLGSATPREQSEWWDRFMRSSDRATLDRTRRLAQTIDLRPKLRKISAPTLVITTDRNELWPVEELIKWQREIRESILCVLPGDGYHVAAAAPEECARQVASFIRSRTASPAIQSARRSS